MKSIKNNCVNEIIINKSKFIAELIKVNSENDVKTILEETKNKYKDATHYCYGYIVDTKKGFSDDGEPNKTAGMPILNVLENNELDYILCVVIRYFGGVKLGAGGLVRAYTKATTECLDKTEIINLISGKKLELTFSYDNSNKINYLLLESKIIKKDFKDDITYQILISEENLNKIYSELVLYTTNTVEIKKTFIEK